LFNIGDLNEDGLLNPGETWYFQAAKMATTPGQHKNIAVVTAEAADGTNVTDDDPSHHLVNPLFFEKLVYVAPPPGPSGNVCTAYGKPQVLTFQYQPGDSVDTAQDSSKAYIVYANPSVSEDPDGVSFVVVTDQADASTALSGGGKQFFRGDVAFDETFSATNATTSFGTQTYIHFFDSQSGGLLQTVTLHTSCSQPIQLNDVIGNATLAGYEGTSGAATAAAPSLGVKADSAPGVQVLAGDQVVFNFQITNLGNIPLTNVQLTDTVLGTVTQIVSDGNGDDVLDPGETWVLTAAFTASELGQHVNVGTVTTAEGLIASDLAYVFVDYAKFFVVDKNKDASYRYTPDGLSLGSSGLGSGNTDPRGTSTDIAADKLWVVDKDKFVYVYQSGGLVGAWKARDLGKEPEGIAVSPSGDQLWIVDRDKKRVLYFESGKTLTSGEVKPTSMFSLPKANDKPKGITTDGQFLWIVDDDKSKEQVFKYTIGGTLLGSWEISDKALEEPTGITVDPNGGETLWIVDRKSKSVYQFDHATGLVSGTKASDAVFALAAGNTDPQGIADPRPQLLANEAPRESVAGESEGVIGRDVLRLPTGSAAIPAATDAGVFWKGISDVPIAFDSAGDDIGRVGDSALSRVLDGRNVAVPHSDGFLAAETAWSERSESFAENDFDWLTDSLENRAWDALADRALEELTGQLL
jgi:uncharacterized repeat protein (TIGR01451 family)